MTTTFAPGRWWAYLQLMRPANIVTAWADILSGFAAAGAALAPEAAPIALVWLLLATTGLYGGGVVFNDVFDAELDAVERPERPIPSDRAPHQAATILGGALFVIGVLAAAQVSWLSAGLAVFIALAALSYNAIAKHHSLFGPLNMGLCRGGNLLLGMSAVPTIATERWYLVIIPILYIGAITAISQGEVHGGKRSIGIVALGLIVAVMGITATQGWVENHLLVEIPVLLLFGGLVVPPFLKATKDPGADSIRGAVKAGVISLIVLDAAIATAFAGLLYGGLIVLLLPLSMGLARLFSVT